MLNDHNLDRTTTNPSLSFRAQSDVAEESLGSSVINYEQRDFSTSLVGLAAVEMTKAVNHPLTVHG